MAQIYEVRHKYVGKDLNILNMPWMCGKRIKYLRNGFTMLKMIKEFDNNNNNDFISRALFHAKHGQLR